jgi:cytochrome c-type biogenesis protein CcmF
MSTPSLTELMHKPQMPLIALIAALGLTGFLLPAPEFGHLMLIMAFAASLLQVSVPFLPLGARQLPCAALLQIAAMVLVAGSFASLLYGFITSDFSIALVSRHSHSLKPMIYKISGTWGNHEGSLLLWVLILVLFGGIFALTATRLRGRLAVITLGVQGAVSTAFLGFSLFTSNPFERLSPAPLEGRGLNPVLQDIGLALHPPMLYLGYVGLSMAFSIAVAGLITGQIDKDWGRIIRPWVLAAWSALTAGIALGSWWAYYELGWGGWWFWDPVENASLMPWLAATALMHSVIAVQKRDRLKTWAVLMAVMAFSLSLVGTFIVRSGLLTSVHSFASDPTRGVFILAVLALVIGLPLILYAWRAAIFETPQDAGLASRDTALAINNLILVIATAIVLIGTFYPLGLEVVTGARITVGPPYFEASFNPVMALALIGMVIGPMLLWARGWRPGTRSVLGAAGSGCIIAIAAGLMTTGALSPGAVAGLALLGWLGAGIAADMFRTARSGRLKSAGLGPWGLWLGHFGMAVFILGALGDSLGREEVNIRLNQGEVAALEDRQYRLVSIAEEEGPNFTALVATLDLEDSSGRRIATLRPEKRFYPAERQTTTEAAIRTLPSGDDYAVLGDGDTVRGYSFRLYHKPLVGWIWGGAVLMALGGILAAFEVTRSRLHLQGARKEA